MAKDPVAENVEGVRQLVESDLNKTYAQGANSREGVEGDKVDALSLPMSDMKLLELASYWENDYRGYEEKIKTRQEWNLRYYLGRQNEGQSIERDKVVPSNLIFEATETFIPVALAKNPQPVVYAASNKPEGDALAKDVKTMLQYHADTLVLRQKLSMAVRHWGVYYLGVLKHGWDSKVSDICLDTVEPQNLILDPNGSIDVYGNYTGSYLGERKSCTAQELIELFEDPEYDEHSLTAEKKAYIMSSVDGKMGTRVTYTEWWTNDYCFYTFNKIVLDKHKNQFWKYDTTDFDEFGIEVKVPGRNHFGRPKMPYTFLSVFSFGKHPHDVTTLIEQNIPNQDLVNKRLQQIDKNLDVSNNSLAVSAQNFNNETAKQAADAVQEGRPILVPQGKSIDEAIKRLPAPNFPSDAYNHLEIMTETTRSVYGTLGISSGGTDQEKTVRGKIIASQQDSSRIGGGIGDKIEQVADNIFNWWVQLYYVFYDEEHYAAIMGREKAVQYITLRSADLNLRLVVSVAPNSMRPHDEITEMNQAIDLWNAKALDPLSLCVRLNDPDPKETAKRIVLWTTNPQLYAATYFPETQPVVDPMQGAGVEQNIAPEMDQSLSANAPNPSISMVGLPKI